MIQDPVKRSRVRSTLVIAILVLLFYALKPVMAKRKAGKA